MTLASHAARLAKAFFIIALIILIPSALINILFGPHATWIAVVVTTAWAMDLGFRSESRLAAILSSHAEPGLELASLERTFERACLEARLENPPVKAPKMRIFQSALPHLVVSRSWFSPGTLHVSRGMLATFSEEEMRAALQLASMQVSSPWMPFRSWFGVIAALISVRIPSAWSRRFLGLERNRRGSTQGPAGRKRGKRRFGDAIGSLFFLIALPFLRICLELTRSGGIPRRYPVQVRASDPVALRRAANKVRVATATSLGSALPGSVMVSGLYLFDPGSAGVLFPIAV